MKRILFILLPLLLLIFTGVFISCDFLLPAPLGRNNPFDDEAQIGKFTLAPSGSDSIVTFWDWHDPLPIIDTDRVIDKIRIVHSKNNRPSGIGLLIDKNVQEYTNNIDWQFNWTGLSNDRDHYFALYAHEKGGLWLAPRHIYYYIDSSISDNNIQLFPVSPPSDDTNFIVYEVLNPSFTPLDVTASIGYNWNAGNFLVLEFNFYESIYFDQFMLNLKNTAPGLDVEVNIWVMKKKLDNVSDWTHFNSDDVLDFDSLTTRMVTIVDGADQTLDFSEIVNRFSVYYTKSIAITVNNSLTVDITNWYIDTHYWGEN